MSYLRSIFSIGMLTVSLLAPGIVFAQAATGPTAASTPPPVVLHSDGGTVTQPDLKGVPPEVAKLILNYNILRDKHLLKQHLLLESLQNATTTEQRAAIREQLQENRQAFLDDLSSFRTQLKDELKGLQGRISNAEFLRIVDVAQGSGGDHRHRGQ
jgi:hypothetical protein